VGASSRNVVAVIRIDINAIFHNSLRRCWRMLVLVSYVLRCLLASASQQENSVGSVSKSARTAERIAVYSCARVLYFC
jgi:hypothetical protein